MITFKLRIQVPQAEDLDENWQNKEEAEPERSFETKEVSRANERKHQENDTHSANREATKLEVFV
jgi:hypothetical protein